MKNQEQTKEERFISWFKANGGCLSGIRQACFEPNSYTGIATDRVIPKNTIIMGVPKDIIIGVEMVRNSELGPIMKAYDIFQGEDNDDKDFNILALFLIMEKMKGPRSFFAPYLQCIEIAETLVHWPVEDVKLIGDPYLTPSFLEEVATDFEPTFRIFVEIAQCHPQLFGERMTRQLFDKCYGMVMTRCFGWGLPETMLVPFADFLNHHSNGVHHYAFSRTLEQKRHSEYVPKGECLSLAIFDLDNSKKLPKGYQKDSRETFIEQGRNILQSKGIKVDGDVRGLPAQVNREYVQVIRSQKARESFQAQLLLSSDSEDNDSLDEDDYEEAVLQQVKSNPYVRRYYDAKVHFKRMGEAVGARKQPRYVQPKPSINRQFEDGVSFDWWHSTKDAKFIVATSRNMAKGEQVFNSYGRRSNRFLLLWYGFTFPQNKYDSVPFRLWSPTVRKQTGKIIFARYVTEKDWRLRIPIGNDRFPYSELSEEFRLKLTELNYYLLAFLRLRLLVSPAFSQYQATNKHVISICDISLQVAVFGEYLEILKLLAEEYRMDPAVGFSSPSRQYFANLLIDSNSSILRAHLRGVKHILELLYQIKEGKANKNAIDEAYKTSWASQIEEIQAKNRIFVGHYYQLLAAFVS